MSQSASRKIVWIVVAAACLSRLAFLGARQLETEELMQALVARSHSPAEFLDRLRGGVFLAAPLDHVVQKCIVYVLGDSAWILRLHAALFGSLAVWAFYRLARLLFSERVTVYSTVLFAFFSLAYHFSQVAQPYALFLFVSLLSYELLLRIMIGREGGPFFWIGLAVLNLLLLFTSFLGLTLLLSQLTGLLILALKKPMAIPHSEAEPDIERPTQLQPVTFRHISAYMAAAGVALLFFLPWAFYFWKRPLIADAGEILTPKLLLRIVKGTGDGSYPAAALFLVGLITGIRALQRHRLAGHLLWLLTWGVLSIPFVIAFELGVGFPFAIHDVLHCMPPLILIAGYGLSYLGEQATLLDRLPHRISAPAFAYAALHVLLSIGIARVHWWSEPVDWRGTAAYLEETARIGDAVTMEKFYGLLEYYSPSLANFRSSNLDPESGSPGLGSTGRRLVACLNNMPRDPTLTFRRSVAKNAAWRKLQRRGFTVYIREK